MIEHLGEALAGFAIIFFSAMSFYIKRQLSLIDESVNHKHKHGRHETLYDLQHSQTLLLEKLNTELNALVEVNQNDHVELFKRIEDIKTHMSNCCSREKTNG